MGDALAALSAHFGIPLDVPFSKLSRKHRDLLLLGPAAGGAADAPAPARKKGREPEPWGRDFEGLIPNLRRRYDEGTWAVQEELEAFRALRACPACDGARLKPESVAVRVKGRTIADYVDLPIGDAYRAFSGSRSSRIASCERSRTGSGSWTTWASGT